MSKKQLQEKMRKYLSRVNPVLERLVVDLLVEMPEDFVSFSVNWFQEKGTKIAKGEVLTQEHAHSDISAGISVRNIEFSVDVNPPSNYQKPNLDTDEEDEEEAGEDVVQLHIEKTQAKNKTKGMRSSVSAEVYGSFNKKNSYVPTVVPKAEEQEKRIETRLMQAFMFSALDERERMIVVGAMKEVTFKAGDWIIKQGEDGENLFVVDQGQLDCFKKFSKDADDTYLKTYQPGEAFGELALLYNAPRAASIQSKTDSVLFSLDRECFNHIVKDSASKKREQFEETLKKVELLDSMDPYERVQLCDGIRDVKYKAGEYVIRQGEEGNNFYMIEEGQLKATKTNENNEEKVVYEYKEGDYFGELALVKNIPRQANVVAATDVRLMYLDHDTFKRLLGPIEGILKRNEDRYEKYNPNNIDNL